MGRFRAPTGFSSSDISSSDVSNATTTPRSSASPSKPPSSAPRQQVNAQAGPSKASKGKERYDIGKQRRKEKARVSPGMGITQKDKLRQAVKKGIIKETSSDWSHVYVSGLNSTISQQMLQDTFGRFGRVKRIIVRSSGGVPIKNYPERQITAWDRQYASVEYFDTASAKRAISFNGRTLNGIPLIVCFSAADLPETRDAFEKRVVKKKPTPTPKGLIGQIGPALAALKRLTIDRTHAVIEPPSSTANSSPSSSHEQPPQGMWAQRDRHIAMGISFAKTLM